MNTLTRIRSVLCFSLLFLLLISSTAFADKAAVEITVPESVKKGDEITVKIKVSHNGNNFIHHVDWAQISINGKEVKRWDFSWTSKPESEIFEREFKYTVTAPVEVSAQADCNMHGSKGIEKKQIKVME
jgi:desulfoferrodoxin (superoxide reductase-like protein)